MGYAEPDVHLVLRDISICCCVVNVRSNLRDDIQEWAARGQAPERPVQTGMGRLGTTSAISLYSMGVLDG